MPPHDPPHGGLPPARVPAAGVSPPLSPQTDEKFLVTEETLGASLTTKFVEHRHAQASAQAEFDRQETAKDNQHRRDRERAETLIDLSRDVAITAVLLVLIIVALAYTGPWVTSPTAPNDAIRFATALWTSVISGGVGYLFGTRRRP